MTLQTIPSPKGELAFWRMEKGERVAAVDDILSLIWNSRSETIVLERSALSESFFDLKSGLAGELLQKISNYRRRFVVLGDFGDLPSRALADFIRESNRGGQVVFAPDLERGIELLR